MVKASAKPSFLRQFRVLALAVCAGAGLAACATTGATGVSASQWRPVAYAGSNQPMPAASQTMAGVGVYKLGAPYQSGGTWYVPAEEPGYDVQGVAGVYGDGSDGKATANGETFRGAAFTGAHPTLPMPAIVEVTNLDNGKTLRVRLNDRGGYKPGRVMDLSRGAANALGFSPQGTAKVRVRYVGPARLDASTDPLFTETARPQPAAPAPAPSRSEPIVMQQASAQVSNGAYGVQAGAFSDPARADQVALSLSRTGRTAVRPVEVSGRTLYRVVVGGFADETAADAARQEVAARGFADARVVRNY